MKYDFSGYATRNNIKCSDGRVIMRDAFKDNDHKKVPLVWQHDHMSPDNVLGHAMLENREDGVYAYGCFNDTPSGLNAKELVKNGDVRALSIYANKLKQDGANVIHGAIREVSLVLAGANPGAYIDTVMVHSDGDEETEDAEICFNLNSNPVIYHSDKVDDKSDEKEKDMANNTGSDDKTVQDVIDSMTDEQKKTSDKIGINDPVQGLYGNSTWLAFKQIMRAPDTQGKKYGDNIRLNNYLVMRYAEVLLNYAEACIQTGDLDEAKKYINKIQERAGSKTISETVDMDVLKKEKSYELWLEGCRWFDIMRWNDTKAIERLTKAGTVVPHLFDKVFRAPKADDQNVTWEHGSEANSRFYTTNTPETNFKVGFKEGKHEFFPYPQTVLDKNPNLKQNPGW